MKDIRIYFHEIESNWCGDEKTSILYIAKTKGFPVVGTFDLGVDWTKVNILHTYEDQKDMCKVYRWEENN